MLLRRLGHELTDVRDAGMRSAPDETIAAYAKSNHLVLITRDFDLADIRNTLPRTIRVSWCLSFTRPPPQNRWRSDWLGSPTGRIAGTTEWTTGHSGNLEVRFRRT